MGQRIGSRSLGCRTRYLRTPKKTSLALAREVSQPEVGVTSWASFRQGNRDLACHVAYALIGCPPEAFRRVSRGTIGRKPCPTQTTSTQALSQCLGVLMAAPTRRSITSESLNAERQTRLSGTAVTILEAHTVSMERLSRPSAARAAS